MATLPNARSPVSPSFPASPVVAALGRAARDAAEHALVLQARRGDTVAVDTLLERHASRVYRVAFAVSGSEASAEAVVRSVFGLLLGRGHTPALAEGLAQWLYRATCQAVIGTALADDTAKDRAALVLADGEMLGDRDVAGALGEPPALVRRRAHRARLTVCDQLLGRSASGPRLAGIPRAGSRPGFPAPARPARQTTGKPTALRGATSSRGRPG